MMLQQSKSRLITILTHILIWGVLGLAIFFYQPVFSGIEMPYPLWIRHTVTLSLLVIAFYVNSSVLVPRLLLKNHIVFYFVMIVAIVAAIAFIGGWVEKELHLHQLFDEGLPGRGRGQALPFSRHRTPGRPTPGIRIDKLTMVISVLVLGIGTNITVVQRWQRDKQERQELEKEKVTSELSFLKAQINPHFFFNTLNNIYALTAVDAEVAGKAVHQLSRMMRYLLYDPQPGHKMLSQEIAFVKDYISLMQLRLTDMVMIHIHTPPHLNDMPLAPMIFLPFVENAFKHGISATQPSHIDIAILQKDQLLCLTVKNSIIRDNSVSLDTNSGIGLMNTRRRLDLLYPGKYKLDIHERNADNEYIVHLVLDLS